MKTTGIVRRIDELGRVVIPKEIRRTMRIKEGEEMEVFVDENDGLILKKYSGLKAMSDFAEELCEVLTQVTGNNSLVCDNDVIVAAGIDRSEYVNKRINVKIEKILEGRRSVFLQGKDAVAVVENGSGVNSLGVAPIIFNGDIIGGVIMFSPTRLMGDGILHLLNVAAQFLQKQI